MGIELGRTEVGVAEHLLHAAEVGAAFEEMGGERMTQEMGMDAARLQAGFVRQAPEDEKDACARERPALRVQEELGAVATVEVRTPAGEIAPQGLGRFTTERDDPLFISLAQAAHDPVVEIDTPTIEADRFSDAKPRPVEKLDERAVAKCARGRSLRGVDQPFDLTRRERPGQTFAPAW